MAKTDIRTAVKRLIRELKIDSTGTGNSAETDAKIAIIDSMNFHKKSHFWFNQVKYKIATSQEVFRYALPVDYVSIIGRPLYNSSSNESATRRLLEYRPIDWCEENKWRGTETEMTINTGSPEVYSVDEATNELVLIPVPYVDGETVEFTYLSDCEIPYYIHDGSSWLFYRKGTTEAISDTFSNAWLENALEMIIYKAAQNMLVGPYGLTEERAMQSAQFAQRWAEQMQNFKGENTKRSSVTRIARHI